MKMSKAITFRDILVKVTKVLPSDLYLINNEFIISGNKSNESTIGVYLYRLLPDAINACKEHFDGNKIYYIKDGKAAKDSLNENYTEVNSDDEISHIRSKKEEIIKLVNKTKIWNTFNFTENEISSLFNTNSTLELFSDNDDIPTVTVSKTLFPYVTEKNVSKLFYNVINSTEYTNLLLSLDYEFFQIYMLYRYIDLD